MKKIIILLLCCITAVMTQAQSRNWCESLVNTLNANENVDKTIAVKRDPSTHEITNATYDYRFTSDNLYKKIAKEMKFRSTNADYYTEKGKKLKTIILRFNDRGRRWSCKLQCLDKKGKQFLVTVSSRDQSSSELQGLTDVERIQDFNERQQEWAKQYKERQQEWAKQYKERQQEWAKQYKERQQEWDKQNRERQQELKKRQQEVRERQRQVQRETRERQREARERQREALERQRLARRQRLNVEGSKGTYYRKHIITAEEEKENKKAIEQHNADLKKAEQERKRKLDL